MAHALTRIENWELRIENSRMAQPTTILHSPFSILNSLLLELRDPLRDAGIVGEFLARLFERDHRVVVAAEDEQDLHAQLREGLVEREVGGVLVRQQRQTAAHELQRHL